MHPEYQAYQSYTLKKVADLSKQLKDNLKKRGANYDNLTAEDIMTIYKLGIFANIELIIDSGLIY